MMPAPTNVLELLSNCRMAIDKNIFLRNDFYSKSYLAADFGAGKFSRLFVNDGKPVPFTRIVLNDFSSVMPSPKPFSGILSTQISTTTEGGEENGKIISARGTINIGSDDDRLSVEHVTEILGLGFVEDKKAENDVFFAIAREPFNPPAKPHFIITHDYSDGPIKKKITADFGSNGRLWLLNFSEDRR